MNVAIIPARGGSKRIPKKNIKDFYGRPMLAYPIAAATESKLFDRVIVSTDCAEIAKFAVAEGAEVPFIRPDELSDDFVGTGPVTKHAINWLFDQGIYPNKVCCIYPTSPFLTADLLREGYRQLNAQPDKSFAFSVGRYSFPVKRALTLNDAKDVTMLFPEHLVTRSQDLEDVFHDAGQFYWGDPDAFLNNKPMFGPDSIPIFLPRHRVMDIDDEEDWLEAEFMYELLSNKHCQ